jgi:peroxiredoxin Q/BCP
MPVPKVGDPAPDFTLQDSNGETVHLSDLRGKKVLLYFFPTPGGNNCTRMALGYKERFDGFGAKNTVIYGMNDREPDASKAWCEKESLPFSVLIDPDRSVGIAYGMSSASSERYLVKPEEGRRPAVVIDEEGRIAAWEQDMNDVAQIEELLQRL